MKSVSRTRIKICGITRADDALAAARLGADAVGMVFHPASARCVSVETAGEICAALPPFVTGVGLFVNASEDAVRAVIDRVPLGLLQFHGDETPQDCARFGRPWVKAARVRPGLDLVEYASRFADAGASALVLDAYSEGYGGAGEVFDWSLIPQDLALPVVLAGGLNPDNVAAAIARVRPWAVDVSSGVEAPGAPKGVKDHALIARFIAGANDETV